MIGQEPYVLPGYEAGPPAAVTPTAPAKESWAASFGRSLAAGAKAALDTVLIYGNRELAESLETTSPFEKKAAAGAKTGLPGWLVPAGLVGMLGLGMFVIAMKKR
jgi:hypothetical protein